jgi:4-amino-4-deoxy-L-arabinose transferase-like glycosyltransferase
MTATMPLAAVPDAAPAGRAGGRRLAVPLPLVAILTIQAVLSARLLRSATAFGDEALYLQAGRLEWAHWLHGQAIPAFQTWFSGSPAIYPPLGALADRLGGLTGARLLSLAFMLGATTLLWGTASRLYGRRAAVVAAALFAVTGPTLHLGAFATYDAMSLLLVALAAWCATGGRDREDATGWILAAAAALALANATKYASAIFDPVVVLLAALSAYPRPGGKLALRRATLLLTLLVGTLAVLLRLGGSWYVAGISQTTVMRPDAGTPALLVLTQAWHWTAVVVLAALAGVVISLAAPGRSRAGCLLIVVLAGAALLVPAEQARIHTTVSLDKHVDFGAWFACIAAGYAADRVAGWLPAGWGRRWYWQAMAAGGLAIALIPVAAAGAAQAGAMINWPGASRLIAFLRPRVSHGGRFLAETDTVPEYYLPQTSWRQWSSTFSITQPDGVLRDAGGRAAPYVSAISHHYFSLVVLSFAQTPGLDQTILVALRATPGYRPVGNVPYGGPVPGSYSVWALAHSRARRGSP